MRLVRGPYLQALFDTSVEIRFTTNIETRSSVVLEGPGEEPFEVEGDPAVFHRIRIEGLSPGSSYTYRIQAGGILLDRGPNLRFRTAPPVGTGSFRAVVVGDSGVASDEQFNLANQMRAADPDLFLHTGDILYLTDVDLGVFNPYRDVMSRSCFFPARGNHDFTLETQEMTWRDLFHIPGDEIGRRRISYSYDWGSAHFLVLDYVSAFADDEEQMDFARADLSAARERGVAWLIVYLHLPIYSIGQYATLSHPIRTRLPDWCDEFGVDLVMSGHDHNFQRTYPIRDDFVRDAWQQSTMQRPGGTVYVVTGGGGAHLYPERPRAPQRQFMAEFQSRHHFLVLDVSPHELNLRAIGLAGATFHTLNIRKDLERPTLHYLRGDADGDGDVDLGDPMALIEWLFLGGELPCPAAASGFDNGSSLVVTHAVYLLNFLFRGGSQPISPFPQCGAVEDADDRFCYEAGC